jgi:hypothetical protein
MRLGFARSVPVVAVLLGALALAGCGGGHHHDHFEGTLEVFNDDFSTDFVDAVDIEGDFDDFFSDIDLLPGDSLFVDLYPDEYEVTIFWGDFSVEVFFVDVFDDFVTTLTVSN